MIIAVDFDGTCVTHEFPKIGQDIGAAKVLKKMVAMGHKLILWTMRSNIDVVQTTDIDIHPEGGDYLSAAIRWFAENEIELWGINQNPDQKSWTISPKVYADVYIDDAAIGCPLKYNRKLSPRPFADWEQLYPILLNLDLDEKVRKNAIRKRDNRAV